MSTEESLIDGVKPVPVASITGAQEGRESPKQRKNRMIASLRRRTKLPVPNEVLEFEKANGITVPDKQEQEEPIDAPAVSVTPIPKKRVYKKRDKPQPRKKILISISIPGAGVYKVPVYDVVDANFGLFVVFADGGDDPIFIPDGASKVVISTPDGLRQKCFYPGVVAKMPGFDACIMAFIKDDTPDGDENA